MIGNTVDCLNSKPCVSQLERNRLSLLRYLRTMLRSALLRPMCPSLLVCWLLGIDGNQRATGVLRISLPPPQLDLQLSKDARVESRNFPRHLDAFVLGFRAFGARRRQSPAANRDLINTQT